jgi:hypothetical protein
VEGWLASKDAPALPIDIGSEEEQKLSAGFPGQHLVKEYDYCWDQVPHEEKVDIYHAMKVWLELEGAESSNSG